MPIVHQTSFAGGEIAPTLYGRKDISKYAVALKRMRNFFASRTGAAMSRPGTTSVGGTKSQAASKSRLVPFVYSDTLAFVLEVGQLYIRFWQNGRLVLSGGGALEVVTPYAAADVFRLQWAQQGAVLTLTHPNYPPAELAYDGTNWTYTPISFDKPAALIATSGYDGAGVAHPGVFVQEVGHSVSTQPRFINGIPAGGKEDSTEPDKEWSYFVTEVWLNARGIAYETKSVQVALMGYPTYGGDEVTGGNGTYGAELVQAGTVQIGGHLNPIYAGDGVAANPGTWTPFWDAGTGYNQGDVVFCASGEGGGVPGQYYRCTTPNTHAGSLADAGHWAPLGGYVPLNPAPTHYDPILRRFPVYPDKPQLLWFLYPYANVKTDPNFLGYRIYRGRGGVSGAGWIGDQLAGPNWVNTFTDLGDAPNYATTPPQGLNPFKVYSPAGVLLRTEFPACVTFYEGRRVFAGTVQRPGFAWLSAVNDYANFDKFVIPKASDSIQFEIASRKLEQIRALAPVGPKLFAPTQFSVWRIGGSQGPIGPSDIDAKSQGEVGSAWLQPVVVEQETALVIRTKGTGVRAFSYDYVRQGYLDGDLSILASHLFVNHNIVDWCYAEDPWGLVLAVRDDGVLLALTYVKEQDVIAWGWWDTTGQGTGPGLQVGNVSVPNADVFESVCSVPEGNEDAIYVIVKRQIGTLTVRSIERFASRVLGCIPGTSQPWPICLDMAGVYNGTPVSQTLVPAWFAGQAVTVLADGNVLENVPISSQSILTLDTPASSIVVGFPYTPQLQLLDVALGNAETKTIDKLVTRIGIDIDNTRGLWTGADFDNLKEYSQRKMHNGYSPPPLESTSVRQWLMSKWDTGGDVCLQQNSPLPLTVLGVTREAQLGDPGA